MTTDRTVCRFAKQVLAVRASPLLEVQSLIIKKMIYKIHYANLDLQGDIPCLEFTSIEKVRSFITSIVYPLKMVNEKVYVIAIQDEVVVTENGLLVEELFDGNLNSAYPFYEGEDIFIQEYPSYEEAYKVALDMKEVSPLCYSF